MLLCVGSLCRLITGDPFLISAVAPSNTVQSEIGEQSQHDTITNKDEDIDGTLLLHKIIQDWSRKRCSISGLAWESCNKIN